MKIRKIVLTVLAAVMLTACGSSKISLKQGKVFSLKNSYSQTDVTINGAVNAKLTEKDNLGPNYNQKIVLIRMSLKTTELERRWFTNGYLSTSLIITEEDGDTVGRWGGSVGENAGKISFSVLRDKQDFESINESDNTYKDFEIALVGEEFEYSHPISVDDDVKQLNIRIVSDGKISESLKLNIE